MGSGSLCVASERLSSRCSRANGSRSRCQRFFPYIEKYVRYCLLHADRRFARDPQWIFFTYDLIEKLNIQSANRRVVYSVGTITRSEIFTDQGLYNTSTTTLVPHIIKSSYAYKKKQALNLRTILNHLGPPQLFLTFSCDDFAQHFADACWGGKPWEDTILFASAFKRRWNHFFNRIIKGRFANLVGGITDYSWVLEEQDRGSPHIHMVLWTGKNVQQLAIMNDLIVANLPDEDVNKPLFDLVNRLQRHNCTAYCFKNRPQGSNC